jgi:hypothetical protein
MKKFTKQERRQKHIEALARLFEKTFLETKRVYQNLILIERIGRGAAESYCNGTIDSDAYDSILNNIKERIRRLELPNRIMLNIHLNGDPRGYFLKLDDDFTRKELLNFEIEKDWGGYAILVPQFN